MELRATRRDIAIILFRFLSIYSFVRATEFLSEKFTYFFNPENYSFGIFIQIIGPSALLIICGVIIWYLSPMFSAWLLMGPDGDEECGFSLNDFRGVAFSTIGLFIIVNSIPELVNAIGFYYGVVFRSDADKHLIYVTGTVHLLSLVIKFVLGLWLLIGAQGVAKFVRALRRD